LHPILVAVPIGLFVFSLIADIIYLAGWGAPHWQSVAYFNLAGGIICALIAALPGFVDLFSVSDPNLRRVGIVHMCVMLLTVVILRWISGCAAASGMDMRRRSFFPDLSKTRNLT
jgi:uncharacterized membrane protein